MTKMKGSEYLASHHEPMSAITASMGSGPSNSLIPDPQPVIMNNMPTSIVNTGMASTWACVMCTKRFSAVGPSVLVCGPR